MITIRLKWTTLVWGLVVIVVLSLGATSATRQARAAQSTPLLWLDPPSASTFPGSSTDVVVRLSNISNIYGAEVHLSFNPAVLAVVDANTGQSGVQITTGSCPAPGFIVTNNANNATGVIDYALTQLNPQTPCSGGSVATIKFQCLVGNATSAVSFTSSIVSDPNGNAISHTAQNGTVECLSNVFSIQGSVALQSWSDPSGTVVKLLDSQGNPVGNPVVVGSSGTFNFVAPVGTTYRIQASYDRYLKTEATGITGTVGSTVNLGAATLRAGDLNNDGVINILDITIVAGNFGRTSPTNWGN